MSGDNSARKPSAGDIGRRGSHSARRKSAGSLDTAVYRTWCDKSQSFVNRERFVVFQTIGRAPVESPPHPARLTPVRQLASAGASSPRARARTSSSETWANDAASSEEGVGMRRPRTFSAHCSKVLGEQGAVQAFNPQRIYLACEFFSVCSLCFIRELVASGEPPLWQGITFDSKAVIYSEGDSGTSMYVIVRGVAEVVCKGREPRELRAHDYFGEAQALGVLTERQETVYAKTSLHALEVSCGTLTNLLRRERTQDMATDGLAAPPKPPASPTPKGSVLNPQEPTASRAPRRTQRCGSASLRFYAFAEERGHFEHLAGHLYQQLVRRHHPPGRRVPTASASTTAFAAAAPSAGNTASSVVQGHFAPAAVYGSNAGAEADEEGGGSAASAAAAPAADEAPGQSPRKLLMHQSSNLEAAGDRKKGSKRNAAATAAAAHVSGVDNPKLWRKHLEEVQLMLTEGDMSDDGNGRERFIQRLTDSIRGDMRRGYMMPADLGKVRKNLVSGNSSSQARSPVMWHGGNSIGAASGSRSDGHGRKRQDQEDESPGEEEDITGEAHLLDLRLLPPLGLMNARQKHALLQQMQRQAKLASRSQTKAAIRQRVASIVHLAGLSKMLSQKKLSANRLSAGVPQPHSPSITMSPTPGSLGSKSSCTPIPLVPVPARS